MLTPGGQDRRLGITWLSNTLIVKGEISDQPETKSLTILSLFAMFVSSKAIFNDIIISPICISQHRHKRSKELSGP